MKYESKLLKSTFYPEKEFVFFWHGPLSQWHKSNFHCTYLNVEVNCAEQAMMLSKAKLFNDMETYDLILKADHPKEQKTLGRSVKNFVTENWQRVCYDIVKCINIDKFSQNEDLKELLFLTYPNMLVEASPFDNIWGIGMAVDNKDILNTAKWGQNLLGHALTSVRRTLMDEMAE